MTRFILLILALAFVLLGREPLALFAAGIVLAVWWVGRGHAPTR